MQRLKQLAKDIYNVGKNRIKIIYSQNDKELYALKRQNVRKLRQKKLLVINPVRGYKTDKKKKNTTYNRTDKQQWMLRVRRLRKMLKENKQLAGNNYRKIYLRIKGNYIKTKRQLLLAINAHKEIS